VLMDGGIITTVRKTRGDDNRCGLRQLAGEARIARGCRNAWKR